MNLFEATHILKSVGYTVAKDLDKQIDETLDMVLESMENRGAVHTKAYSILAEMAIKRPRNVTEDNPWNEYDERFSKLQATIQSKMTRGGVPRPGTLAGWRTELAAIADHLSNPSCLRELNNIQAYLDNPEAGDEVYTSSTPKNTGVLTGDFAHDRKNIAASISSFGSKGGKNYDALLARIDELEQSCGEEVSNEEAMAIDKLRIDLETARVKAEGHNNSAGKTAIFRPASTTPIALNHIKYRLTNQAKAEYTQNEDGTFTITSKVARAKAALEGMGEFVTPEAAAAPSTDLTFTIEDPDTIAFLNDIVSGAGAHMTNEDGIVTITGTPRQMAATKAAIEENIPDLLAAPEDVAEGPVEPVAATEEVETPADEEEA